MKTTISLSFLLLVGIIPTPSLAGTIFIDNFSNGSTVNQFPINPGINYTSYEIVSSKSWNPIPSITFNDLDFGINATSSGVIEAQALFATSPVKLSAVGDQIQLTVTFADTAGLLTGTGTMGFGLYDSGQIPPVSGGLNSTATTNNSDAATGWAQSWQGYVGQISYAGGNSQIISRAAQTGAYNNNQDLVTSGSQSSSYRNPPATTIGSKNVSTLNLNAGSMYTEVFQITLLGANTLAITNTLYSGPSVYGSLISQVGAESFGTNFLVDSFDGFAIGWRETSNQPTVIDITSIQVSDQISSIPPASPQIISQPISQAVASSGSCSFSVAVSGNPAPNCQWQFNGQNITGATGTILTLNSVTAANSGAYSVIVSNPYGLVASTTASLAVLDDGASGNTPVQVSSPPAPSQQASIDSLVIITHGFIPVTDPRSLPSWVPTLADEIQMSSPPNWLAISFDWSQYAWGLNPEDDLSTGYILGTLYGQKLNQQRWKNIHLIAHSAGSAVIQGIADQLKFAKSPPTIQMTFLDPFVGLFHEWQSSYGEGAAWADCYFTQDLTGGSTGGGLPHAYNIDVDWLAPDRHILSYGSSMVAVEFNIGSHGFPVDFYTDTVTGPDPTWCSDAETYGFLLSEEANGEGKWASYQTGNDNNPYVLCGPANSIPSPTLPVALTEVAIDGAQHAASDAYAAVVSGAGFELHSVWSSLPLVKAAGAQPMDETSTNVPAWLAVGVSITNPVNFVQFDAEFTDTSPAQGLLTVYWNTNQIGMLDERAALTNLQTYRFELPSAATEGIYSLSFRLDSFDNSSSIMVTNVTTGFVGVAQPIALSISITNNLPLLQLTGATNTTYLLQISTNLIDWSSVALLLNTNGAAQFLDSAAENSKARYYRAVSQ